MSREPILIVGGDRHAKELRPFNEKRAANFNGK
jgi:hypothetical protein